MAALGAHEAPSYRNLAFGLGKTGSAVTPGRFAERIYYQLEYKPSFKNPLYNEPLAEFPEGEEFPVDLDCGRRRLRLALA